MRHPMSEQEQAPNGAFPPAVAKAIVGIMGDVKKLPKEDSNDYAKYRYTSIDGFLDAMRPICAKHKLAIITDEDGCRVDESGKNLWVCFTFILVHESGESWTSSPRTVAVSATGAQAFGSAQSYALKQFMRATFQIATGDADDPDGQKAEPLSKPRPRVRAPRKMEGKAQKPPPPQQDRPEGTNTVPDKVDPQQLAFKFTSKKITEANRKKYLKARYNITSLTELSQENLKKIWAALDGDDAKKRFDTLVKTLTGDESQEPEPEPAPAVAAAEAGMDDHDDIPF